MPIRQVAHAEETVPLPTVAAAAVAAEPAALGPGSRSQLKRRAERGSYDSREIFAIIDEALCCHVAFSSAGEPRILPMAFARDGASILLHGAKANGMLRELAQGGPCSIAFTLLDGLVFAAIALNHSVNYRSVIVFGRAKELEDAAEKQRALELVLEQMAPGRSAELAALSADDVRGTLVLRVDIEEASAKVRSGGASNDGASIPTYVGVLPLRTIAMPPQRHGELPPSQLLSPAVAARAARLNCAYDVTELREEELLFSSDPSRLDMDFIHAFLADSYWARGIERRELVKCVERSLCFGLYRDGRQLGFGRAITDGARFGYLADIFIDAEERGRGFGTRLVTFMLAHPALRDLPRILLGTRDAQGLYARFGFEPRAGVVMMARTAAR